MVSDARKSKGLLDRPRSQANTASMILSLPLPPGGPALLITFNPTPHTRKQLAPVAFCALPSPRHHHADIKEGSEQRCAFIWKHGVYDYDPGAATSHGLKCMSQDDTTGAIGLIVEHVPGQVGMCP